MSSVYNSDSVTLPDPVGRNIRLLTIHPSSILTSPLRCSLCVRNLDSRPNFEALSYTWGDPTHLYPILIDEKPFQVRRNLLYALRHLRLPDRPRRMWIDAVCIDQSNVSEREQTVRFMREIYASALDGVVVWLGEEGHDTYLVAPFLDKLINGFKRREEAESKWMARVLRQKSSVSVYGGPALDDPGWRALYNLLITPWSSRVWIVQEVVMAPRNPEIRVLRGKHIFTMERIALAMSTIYKYNLENELKFKYPARFATLWGERITRTDSPTLLEVVRRNWLTYASDPRDKIYGLAGLASDVDVSIDYSEGTSADKVFTDFARSVIQKHRNLAILGALASVPKKPNLHLPSSWRSIGLPSWVPDWRTWEPHTFIMMSPELDAEGRGFMHFMAAGAHSLSFDPNFSGPNDSHLQVRGHIIDTIDGGIIGTGPVSQFVSKIDDVLEFLRRSEYVAQVQKEYTVIGEKQRNYGDAIVKIDAKKNYSYTGETLLEAFYATLTMDDLHHRHQPRWLDTIPYMRRRRLRKIYYDFHKLTHMLRESSLGMFHQPSFLLPGYNLTLLNRSIGHYVTQAMSVCVNRRLVKTAGKGYLGMFTNQVQEGDSVVLLEGARLPFVMRKSKKAGLEGDAWEIVGDGYLHGAMGGGAWDEKKCRFFTLV